MQFKSTIKSWLGALLFLIGVLTGLMLSASVTWGESEAGLYFSYNADGGFRIKCPYMLAPTESGKVSARITNITDEDVKPVVTAAISSANLPREIEQTVPLIPKESRTVEWTLGPSDEIFGRLILVNVLQSRYRDNPSFLASCGILLFSLFHLTGAQTFSLLIAISLVGMLSGGTLWLKERPQPSSDFSINLTRICTTLMSITIFALLSIFPRWWGLTLILDALIVLVTGVILTDFGILSKYRK
jgi:hypothetical protein